MLIGSLSGPQIGELMLGKVRQAMSLIRDRRDTFVPSGKLFRDGRKGDVVTDADREAQACYVSLLKGPFSGVGGTFEEDDLRIPCTLPDDTQARLYADGLDGTISFSRKRPFGVATMAALEVNGEIICAYIGDVNTGDIYGYEPDGPVVLIRDTGLIIDLGTYPRDTLLHEGTVLVRDMREDYGAVLQAVTRPRGVFKEYQTVRDYSIGLTHALLWTDPEVVALVQPARGHDTPWDNAPFTGIGRRLGYVWLRLTDSQQWVEYLPTVPAEPEPRTFDRVVLHRNHAVQFAQASGMTIGLLPH